jgi:hypothetical protein
MSFSSVSSKPLENDDDNRTNELADKSDDGNDEPLDPRIQV